MIDRVAADPHVGDVVPGSGGLRKLRVGLEGRGRRSGGRVIYWFYNEGHPVVLLWCFAKNESSDLTPEQRKRVVAVAEKLIEDADERRGFRRAHARPR